MICSSKSHSNRRLELELACNQLEVSLAIQSRKRWVQDQEVMASSASSTSCSCLVLGTYHRFQYQAQYVLHILGLTALGLEKHQDLSLKIVLSQAIKPYGPRLLKTFCPRTSSPKVWKPMSQGLGSAILIGQNKLFVFGVYPRTHELFLDK